MRLLLETHESNAPGRMSNEEQHRAEETSGFWPPAPAPFSLLRHAPALTSLACFLFFHTRLVGRASPPFSAYQRDSIDWQS